MKIALIADAFPPMRSSAAVQLRDLSREFAQQGHKLTLLLPASDTNSAWSLQESNGVQVLRLSAPRTKDISYMRRTLAELCMPFWMLRHLRSSPLALDMWDGVIWYSPSIFHGPLVKAIKKSSQCKSYLILRDIFPEWALDMGLMSPGLTYTFFSAVARYQYSLADAIGVQTAGNMVYLDKYSLSIGAKVEVLQNWLADVPSLSCSVSIAETSLAGRKIFVYAGNMGVAQGMDALLNLAERLRFRKDVGFLFVGRGSEAQRLSSDAVSRGLDNVMFHDEIDPDEIPGLYSQCHIGMLALDPRHKSHNIPGKFLTYMQSGLPVLASINPGNDLAKLIRDERVGKVAEGESIELMEQLALELIDSLGTDNDVSRRSRKLYSQLYSPEAAVRQIVEALS
jgi:glycosyltransferase involved in cell wall biosynthesis